MKKPSPTDTWLQIAAEARPQMPAPPPDEPVPGWFVSRVLAEWRSARRRGTAGWFVLPGLGRAAAASVVLAAACAVFVLSTGGLDVFEEPIFPEMEEFDLP